MMGPIMPHSKDPFLWRAQGNIKDWSQCFQASFEIESASRFLKKFQILDQRLLERGGSRLTQPKKARFRLTLHDDLINCILCPTEPKLVGGMVMRA